MATQRCPATGKTQYNSDHAARKAMRAINTSRRGGGRMHAYKCGVCHYWHVGH